MKKPKTFSHEFWSANLISRWHDFTLRPVQPGDSLRLRLRCIAHAYNHSGAHADASVASPLTYVLRVPLLISASVPLAVRSSLGRTVWRAQAGWSCLLRSPSLSGSKPSGSKLTTLPLEGLGQPWLIPPGTVEASGTEKGKLQPPQLHIRHKSAVRLLAGLSWRVMEWWRCELVSGGNRAVYAAGSGSFSKRSVWKVTWSHLLRSESWNITQEETKPLQWRQRGKNRSFQIN